MRYAIVEKGVVVNVVLSDDPPKNGVASDTANIGDTYADGQFVAPEES